MANSNNICTRFINYFALLILAFLSSQSFAWTGGAGAGGSWDDAPDQCKPQYYFTCSLVGFSACYGGKQFPSMESIGSAMAVDDNAGITGCKMTSEAGGHCTSTRNARQFTFTRHETQDYNPDCDDKCPAGYENVNGKCQPKKCPAGETLVNGQCQKKQCPAGQALDANGQCFPADDMCPAGQEMVNGRCRDKDEPDEPDEPDPEANLPPFCEWASVMCQWYEDWKDFSNDYNANEQKANLDREELKRLALDSKETLIDIQTAIQNQSLTLGQIKQQDQQFYDELRLWLNNFDDEQGTPSEQYPPVEFPAFCDWSVQVCNWYLDWQDWRTDYNANNDVIKQKLDQHLERLQEMKEQDAEHYQETKSFYSRAKQFFDETLSFFDEIRDFLAQQGEDSQDDPSGEITPEQQDIQIDETQRINFVSACPAGEQFTVSFMGTTQNLEFSYQPLCQFMSMIRPFVIAIAYLIAAYIVMGLSRGSSE